MTSLIVSVGLALSFGATGQYPASYHPHRQNPKWVFPPGPGYGWGFPNGNPDGYGFFDVGIYLPLGADRTTDYFFRRYYDAPADQLIMSDYYNPYVNRGQRYISYVGCAPGFHPAGGPAQGSADSPMHPYNDTIGSGPRVAIPEFSGRIEASPVNSGGTGLTP